MAGGKTDEHTLSAIKPPASPPSDLPDAGTQQDINSVAKLTPTQQITAAYLGHINTLNATVEYHKVVLVETKSDHQKVCDSIGAEVDELKAELRFKQQVAEFYIDRCARLETAATTSGTVATLSTLSGVAAGALLGYPGSMPNLNDVYKAAYTGAGVVSAVASVLLGLLALYLGQHRKASPPKSETPSPQPPSSPLTQNVNG
ncbi:MAG: hypothetical protein U0871_22815 [Gemmataceae bacterium]